MHLEKPCILELILSALNISHWLPISLLIIRILIRINSSLTTQIVVDLQNNESEEGRRRLVRGVSEQLHPPTDPRHHEVPRLLGRGWQVRVAPDSVDRKVGRAHRPRH